MILPQNFIARTGIIVLISLLVFVGLGYGSVFFEFLVLGWGSSDQAPDFNADLTSISLTLILIVLAYRKKALEYAISAVTVLISYLTLKLVFGLI